MHSLCLFNLEECTLNPPVDIETDLVSLILNGAKRPPLGPTAPQLRSPQPSPVPLTSIRALRF